MSKSIAALLLLALALTANGQVAPGAIGPGDQTMTGDLTLPTGCDVTPSLAWGDGDTGLCELVDDLLQWYTAGTARVSLNSSALSGTGFLLRHLAGTAANKTLSVPTDKDTGIWFPAANEIAIGVDGDADGFHMDSTGVGIGTDTPDYALDLVGEFHLDDFFRLEDNKGLVSTSSDGADNIELCFSGGGACSAARGAMITMAGNEDVSRPGAIEIYAGTGTAGYIKLATELVTRILVEDDGVDIMDCKFWGSLSTAPAGAECDSYYDSDVKKLCIHNGTGFRESDDYTTACV